MLSIITNITQNITIKTMCINESNEARKKKKTYKKKNFTYRDIFILFTSVGM